MSEARSLWGLRLLALALAGLAWFLFSGEKREPLSEKIVDAAVRYDPPDNFLLLERVENVRVSARGPLSKIRSLTAPFVDVFVTLPDREGVQQIALGDDQVILPEGLELISVEPNVIQVTLDRLATRFVPVVRHFRGRARGGSARARLACRPQQGSRLGPGLASRGARPCDDPLDRPFRPRARLRAGGRRAAAGAAHQHSGAAHGERDRGARDPQPPADQRAGTGALAAVKTLLSVNVDHVATLRQARGVDYPDPVDAARIAEDAGASGITVHLRSDRRHIQDRDVERLRESVRGKLNLEMATTEEMLALAVGLKPQQVTLVPERPDEVTTEGGLDLESQSHAVAAAAERLRAAGIAVSLFLDPQPAQIEALGALGNGTITGFEINTDRYTRATETASDELAAITAAAKRGHELGFAVYAGHGLTTANVGPVAALPEIEELNIGHWLISRAALVGLHASVREMLDAMDEASGDR